MNNRGIVFLITLIMINFILFCILAVQASQRAAHFTLSAPGFSYQPSNTIQHLSTLSVIKTVTDCTIRCLNHFQCRTFNFDGNTRICELFEGSIDTGFRNSIGGTCVTGWIDMAPSHYQLYHAPFDQCLNDRYLYSNVTSGLCECPVYTFWDGSMCLDQRFIGGNCVNDDWYRSDLNLRCNGSVCFANFLSVSTLTSTTSFVTSTTSTRTTTAITTTMSSTASTTLTASLPCAATLSSNGILYSVMNPVVSMYTYTCFSRTWIATSASATLSFNFRNDPSYWSLDDVAVYHGTMQILVNGGFENGLTGWTRIGNCNFENGSVYHSSMYARSGSYYYGDACADYTDTLSQTFATVVGDTYGISFWLANDDCCSTVVIANITIR